MKPLDIATRNGQVECANYLLMAQATTCLSHEMHALLAKYQKLQDQHELLRTQFR